MVLSNYTTLTPGVPKRLHFIGHAFSDAPRVDPLTGLTMIKRALVFIVDREDGQTVSRTFSTMAKGLADQLAPDLEAQRYVNFEYTITVVGAGFTSRWMVRKDPYLAPRS